jgi:hypothetical protein
MFVFLGFSWVFTGFEFCLHFYFFRFLNCVLFFQIFEFFVPGGSHASGTGMDGALQEDICEHDCTRRPSREEVGDLQCRAPPRLRGRRPGQPVVAEVQLLERREAGEGVSGWAPRAAVRGDKSAPCGGRRRCRPPIRWHRRKFPPCIGDACWGLVPRGGTR